MFEFEIVKEDKKTRARAGILHTPHGDIKTPFLNNDLYNIHFGW